MHESMYQFVLDQLEQVKGSWPDVARETGMSLSTLKKIVYKDVENPGVIHIEKLAKYFRDRAAA